jgi:MFS family permease
MAQIVISDIVSLRDRCVEESCLSCSLLNPPIYRGKYQGIVLGVVAFGYAVGPILGGVLAQKVSWRVSDLATDPFSRTHLVRTVVLLDQHTTFCLCDTRCDLHVTFKARARGLLGVNSIIPVMIEQYLFTSLEFHAGNLWWLTMSERH